MSASLWAEHCVARGDYVVTIDYELLEWPARNGTSFLLQEVRPPASEVNAAIQRYQDGAAESILGFSPSTGFSTAINGTTGSLRLTRRGTVVTAAYREGTGQWKELPVEIPSVSEAAFQIQLVTDEFVFGSQTVRVAVDNFALAATEVTCR